MSIIGKQYPKTGYIGHLHQSKYPEWYTCESDNSSEDNFRYIFKIEDENGLIGRLQQNPYLQNAAAVYNPSKILSSNVSFDFNPEISQFTTCPNGLIQYKLTIEENFDGTIDTQEFPKRIAFENFTKDWDFEEYVMEDAGKFLTNNRSLHKVTMNDRGTLRFLNGDLRYRISTLTTSYIYENRLIVYYSNGNEFHYVSNVKITGKPKIYKDQYTYDEDLQYMLMELPSGPKNILDASWKLHGIYYVADKPEWANYGWNSSGGNIGTTQVPELEVGRQYEIMTNSFPKGDEGITSERIKYEIVCPGKYSNFQLAYQNQLGGTDYFTFKLKHQESLNVMNNTFKQNRYSLNTSSFMVTDQYSRGEKTFYIDYTTKYTLISDWISDDESIALKDLWKSPEVFVRIDDDWFPIIIEDNEFEIKKKQNTKLYNYTVKFRLSNK